MNNDFYNEHIETKSKQSITVHRKKSGPWLSINQNPSEVIPTTNDATSLIFCVTLYNESAEMIGKTLASISRSASSIAGEKHSTDNILICIIADGAEKISESTMRLFYRLGLYSDDMSPCTDEKSLHIAESRTRLIDLESLAFDEPVTSTSTKRIQILLCTKKQNAGKLDSHWWFYEKICRHYQPDICFQIDAGSILDASAIGECLRQFATDERIAATASNVLIENTSSFSFLDRFQSGDFVVQKTFSWPLEHLFGYLSVIPGQFCAISWKAFSKPDNKEGDSPLSRYLKGMKCESAFEKTKYLAEDRVLGVELITDKGSDNRLTFASKSVCFTDPCETIGELLKQRRRWINSAFMCRTWMMMSMYRYLKHSSSPISTKARTSCSIVPMLWMHLIEWFQPFLTILILTSTHHSLTLMRDHGHITASAVNPTFLAILLTWLLPTFLAVSGAMKWIRKSIFERLCQLIATASVAVLLIGFAGAYASKGSAAPPPSIFVFILCTIFGAAITGKHLAQQMRRSFVPYLLVAGPINLMLYCYAFLNLHDSSWGTKGLGHILYNDSTEERRMSKSLGRLRNIFVGSWIASNAALSLFLFEMSSYLTVQSTLNVLISTASILGLTGVLAINSSAINRQLNTANKDEKFTRRRS